MKPMTEGYEQSRPDKERFRPSGAPRGTLKRFCEQMAQRWERRDTRIVRSRSMLLGELAVPMPDKITDAILKVAGTGSKAESLKVRLPQGTVVPLKTVNVLQRKRPRLKRARGMGILKMQKSSHVEKWVNAALETVQLSDKPLFDWAKMVELLFNEGEAGVVVMPTDAHWEKVPSFKDEEGTIHAMYREKDKEGNDDQAKSLKNYEAVLTDYQARRLPWTVRIIHASDCYPLFGPNDQLDGMVVRSVHSRDALIQRGYRWEGMDDHLSAIDEYTGTSYTGPEVTVYEWYGRDVSGDIYVLYEVEGKDTWTEVEKDKKVDTAINLTKEYGLTRLPCTYKFGWHFETKDPQDRGIPFIYPFIPSLLGVDALATATTFHTWWLAFGGKFYKPDPELPPEAWLFEGQPRKFDMLPMTWQALPGQVQDVGNRNVGEDVHRLIALMAGATEQEMPGGGGGAFGAGTAQSGIDRSMMRNYLEDSVSQVFLAGKEAYEFAGETLLELACHLAEEYEEGIPVYANIDPGPQGEKTNEEAELIILKAGDAGLIYDMQAFFPTKHGEFLAQGQQLAEFVKQELATFEEFREMVFGDEQPEETRIAIQVNKMLNSPMGQQYVMELAMEYLGEDKMKRMVQLQQAQQMTENGTPTAALTGVFPGNPGNVMSGMGGASAGKQQLGGAVAAGLGNRDQSRMSAVRSASGSGPENLR